MPKSQKPKNAQKSKGYKQQHVSTSNNNNVLSKVSVTKYQVLVLLIAVSIGYVHSQHVYNMFEKQRFFSHLSTLERELSFRTEMGLYYSYYKTIAEAPSLLSGLHDIVRCNITEYPSKVNVLRRFNLYPEVILGMAYRIFKQLSLISQTCYSINRGQGMTPVQSCEGMGDIAHFYVFPIFWLSGVQIAVMFILGVYLAENLLGGFLAVGSFFYNHGESTRVMWTPPLRESFSFPFLMIQLLTVMYIIKVPKPNFKHSMLLAAATTFFMLPWQFAQFALLTQVCSLFVLYILKFMDAQRMLVFLYGLLTAHGINFVAQFANTLLISSFFMAAMFAILIIVKCEEGIERLPNRILIWLCQGISFIVLSVSLKIVIAKIFMIKDDAHIFDILKSKFSDYKDFHTQLYVCAPEFDFIGYEYFRKISKTLLFPCACLAALVLVCRILWNEYKYWVKGETLSDDKDDSFASDEQQDSSSPVKPFAQGFYLLLQTILFMIMAILIMRLKLFGSPALCLMTSLLASRKLFGFAGKKLHHYAVVVLILALMSVEGFANLKEQLGKKGEFNNPALENLIEWVNANTKQTDVFAGAMPTMAAIKLSCKRPIVNHPHYEDSGLRARTKRVYQMYSKKPCDFVHSEVKDMGVTHFIYEDSWCFRSFRGGCALPEIWDVEDPANRNRPSCCSLIRNKPHPFTIIHTNDVYVVLKVN